MGEDFFNDKDKVNQLVKKYTRRLLAVLVTIPCVLLLRQFLFRTGSAYYHKRVFEYCMSSYDTPFGSSKSPSSPISAHSRYNNVRNHEAHRLILAASLGKMVSSAFCRAGTDDSTAVSNSQRLHYPLEDVKVSKHAPWVWDAVIRPGYPYVDLLIVDRAECMFNQTDLLIARSYLSSSTLSSTRMFASMDVKASTKQPQRSTKAHCHFYSTKSTNGPSFATHVGTTSSRDVFMGTMIRCPLPNILLNRGVNDTQDNSSTSNFQIALQWQDNAQQDMTSKFPICALTKPPLREGNPNEIMSTSSMQHNRLKFSVAACSTLEEQSRKDDNSIIAWIEYHKMMGVEHFFLYDLTKNVKGTTDTFSSDTSINTTREMKLERYIKSGIVTLIPWRYHGCVNAIGDPLSCEDPLLKRDKNTHAAYALFTPPGNVS